MNRRFTQIVPALGISVPGLVLGPAVAACSPASSSGASPAAVAKRPLRLRSLVPPRRPSWRQRVARCSRCRDAFL